jgi:tetratricopeptide (TPR) repeat protein
LAYSGLADAYSILPSYGVSPSEGYPKSNAAARKALDLDPNLARAHAVLGSNEMEYDWDFTGGEAEYRKAFDLDPNDATAHSWYALDIGMIGGRAQEAIAEANRARQLDPLSPIIRMRVGDVHLPVRQYDEAIGICEEVANEDRDICSGALALFGPSVLGKAHVSEGHRRTEGLWSAFW